MKRLRHWLNVLACAVSPDGHPGAVRRVRYFWLPPVARADQHETQFIDGTVQRWPMLLPRGEIQRVRGSASCSRCGALNPELTAW